MQAFQADIVARLNRSGSWDEGSPSRSRPVDLTGCDMSTHMRRRLTFLPALVDRPTLEASPYIYCAVTNNLALCCLLHARNVLPQQPVVVAAFSAGGWAGVTPWQKRISVSSAETALMAGARTFLYTGSMGSRH